MDEKKEKQLLYGILSLKPLGKEIHAQKQLERVERQRKNEVAMRRLNAQRSRRNKQQTRPDAPAGTPAHRQHKQHERVIKHERKEYAQDLKEEEISPAKLERLVHKFSRSMK